MWHILILITSSFACFARSATSPSFAYLSNPVPDSSLCRAAAPRLRPLQLLLPARLLLLSSWLASASAASRHLRPLQLLLSIASVSTASRLRPLRLLLPRLRPLQLCSPMASVSSAAPRDCVRRFGCCSPPAVLEGSSHVHYSRTFYAVFEVQWIEVRRSRVTIV